jgi:hypothetical protein
VEHASENFSDPFEIIATVTQYIKIT